MKIAVIPARGGSKRIPRKNIRLFCGTPMIGWSIQAAQESNIFNKIVVSTDDEEIADLAREFGAEVPFMRPKNLSDDYTGTGPVVNHAIEWLSNSGIDSTHVCCIYATAPFVRGSDLSKGLNVLLTEKCDFSFSVTSFASSIQRALVLGVDGRVEMLDQSQFQTRSQDLQEAYHDAGQFYWGTKDAWMSGQPIFGLNSVPIILPRARVQDIDTMEDWEQAQLLMQALNGKSSD
jgi:pseudaminic acid cytidylyltransferase